MVERLSRLGLTFGTFTLVDEGAYHPDDADWNYKDVPHLAEVHRQIDAVVADVADDSISNIALQKLLGVPLPLTLHIYASSNTSQIYFTSWLAWVLVIETRWVALDANTTRVETIYSVGSHRRLRWMFPLVRWALTRNYRTLMAEDLPMRKRRGELRARGYGFVKPGERHSYVETIDVLRANVVPPADRRPVDAELDLSSLSPEGRSVFIGEDDHLGLRLTRKGNRVLVHRRMCPHEGASLDASECSPEGKLRCPWHGRRFAPELDLPTSGGEGTTEQHRIECHEGKVRIRAREIRAT